MARGYIFVPDLTRLSLIWARLLSALSGREIIYLRLAESLQGDAARARLQRIRVQPFSFEDCNDPECGYYYGDTPGTATAVAEELLNTECFSRSLSLYSDIDAHEVKLRIVLRSYVDQECFDLGHVLAWLTGQRTPGPSWILAPAGFIRRRFLQNSGLDIRPCPGAALLPLVTGLAKLGSHFRRTLSSVRRPAPTPGAEAPPLQLPERIGNPATFPAQVLFFPHQTVSYGGLFFKDQFYSQDADSPFHPSRILHVELQPPRHVTSRLVEFHRTHGIHWTLLPLSAGRQRIRQGLNAFRQVFQKVGLSVARRPAERMAFSILGRARWQFLRYRQALAAFPDARVALIGYEILIPKLLYLALDSRGIRTAASQERFHAPVFYDNWNFILDTYFTGSEAVSRIVCRSRFKHAANTVAVGQVRTDLLARYREELGRREVLGDHGEYSRLVVVFDSPVFANPDVARMMYVANQRSNLAFYRELIALAECFPDTLFMIRSKDLKWTRLSDYLEVVSEIRKTPNLDISSNYETPAFQYRLAAVADLVIAKYTSIGDECMGLGIPVIFHDYTPVLSAMAERTFDYDGLPVFVHDFDSLAARTRQVLNDGHYLDPADVDRLARLVNGARADGQVRGRIGQYLPSLLPDALRVDNDAYTAASGAHPDTGS